MYTRNTNRTILLILAATFLFGCANKEMIKEPSAPNNPVPQQQLQVPPGSAAEKARETAKETVVKEETNPGNEATSRATVKTASLETAYFDFDSYVLVQSARDVLYRNYQWLKDNPAAKIQIEGHSDERGSEEYNLALGENRAKAAMQYLMTLSIPAERMSFISYGEEKPAVTGHDEKAWSKNRRVEFVVIK